MDPNPPDVLRRILKELDDLLLEETARFQHAVDEAQSENNRPHLRDPSDPSGERRNGERRSTPVERRTIDRRETE